MERDETGRPDKPRRPRTRKRSGSENRDDANAAGALAELLRRAATLGFSGLFTTEEAIRKALGDTLPQDWVDFAALQSDRARADFLDRLVPELGRVLEKLDTADLLDQLLDGRSVEITAKIRFVPRSESASDDTNERPPDLKLAIGSKRAGRARRPKDEA